MAAGDVQVGIDSNNFRRCASFDGVDDEIILTDSSVNNFDIDTPFTLTSWIYKVKDADAGTNMALVGKKFTVAFQLNDSGKFQFGVRGTGSNTTITALAASNNHTWTHLVGVFDGTDVILYLNGTLQNSSAAPVDINTGQPDWRFGRKDSNGTVISGVSSSPGASIGLTKLYLGKALSATEVLRDYGGEDVDGLTNKWKFEGDYTDSEGSADGTNDGSYLTIRDSTVAASIAGNRVSPTGISGHVMMVGLKGGQILNAVIEE